MERQPSVTPSGFSAATISASIRSGATSGTRVCQRRIFTCAIAATLAPRRFSRRGESTSGSPPVTTTSQIAGRSDIGERCLKLGIGQMRRPAWPDALAAKTEAAIDRADFASFRSTRSG